MPPTILPRARIPPGGWLFVALMVLLVAWAVLSGIPLRELPEHVIAALRRAGPVAFFTAMAVVPAPLLWFTVPAGEAFAGELTLPGVIAVALVAVGIQIALMYWLARYALRPRLAAWVSRRGYSIPRVTAANALRVTLIVRFTPGPPLVIGCFILGLAEVPFRLYLLVSWLVAVPWIIGGIVLGRGILQGDFKLAAAGLGLLVVAVVAVTGWRKRQRPDAW